MTTHIDKAREYIQEQGYDSKHPYDERLGSVILAFARFLDEEAQPAKPKECEHALETSMTKNQVACRKCNKSYWRCDVCGQKGPEVGVGNGWEHLCSAKPKECACHGEITGRAKHTEGECYAIPDYSPRKPKEIDKLLGYELATWKGKPLFDMSRAELYDALEELGELYRGSLERSYNDLIKTK